MDHEVGRRTRPADDARRGGDGCPRQCDVPVLLRRHVGPGPVDRAHWAGCRSIRCSSPGDWRWCWIRWRRRLLDTWSASTTRPCVVIDVNARPAVIADRARYLAKVARGVGRADVVKASDEDLALLARRSVGRRSPRGGRPGRRRDRRGSGQHGRSRVRRHVGRSRPTGRADRRHDRRRRHVRRSLHGGMDGRTRDAATVPNGPRRRGRPRRVVGPSGSVMPRPSIVVTRHGADPRVATTSSTSSAPDRSARAGLRPGSGGRRGVRRSRRRGRRAGRRRAGRAIRPAPAAGTRTSARRPSGDGTGAGGSRTGRRRAPATSGRSRRDSSRSMLDQLDHRRVVTDRRRRRAELGQRLAGVDVPVDDQLAGGRIGEQHPQQVASRRFELDDARIEPLLGVVPGEELPVRPEHVRRAPASARRSAVRARSGACRRRVDADGAGLGERQQVLDARPRRGAAPGRSPTARRGEALMRRPCSSHVYQVSDTPASIATSSRRSPGVRRPPPDRQPDLVGSDRFTARRAGTRRAPVRWSVVVIRTSRALRDQSALQVRIVHAFGGGGANTGEDGGPERIPWRRAAHPRRRRVLDRRHARRPRASWSRSSRRRSMSTRSPRRPRCSAAIIERQLGSAPTIVDSPTGRTSTGSAAASRRCCCSAITTRCSRSARSRARPFAVADGQATGPGVFDMHGGIVQALHGLAALDDLGRVEMLFSADEEVGSIESRALIEERAVACGAVLVLEPSADGGLLKTGRKGNGHVRGRRSTAVPRTPASNRRRASTR